MNQVNQANPSLPPAAGGRGKKIVQVLVFCAVCTALNVAGGLLSAWLSLPLYLDTLGTMLAAAVGGYLPGIAVGYISNLVFGIFNPVKTYFGVINVLQAAAAAFLAQRDCFRKPTRLPLVILTTAAIGGVLGSALSWCLSGFAYEWNDAAGLALFLYRLGLPAYPAMMLSDFATNLEDKIVTVLLAALLLRLLPSSLPNLFRMDDFLQAPLPEDLREAARGTPCRSVSLRTKVLVLIGTAGAAVSIAAISISGVLYRQATIDEHIKLGQGIASLAASSIDPERIDEYIALGHDAPGYDEAEARLYTVRDSSPNILYLYCYRILPDGCHVVFDLDTEDVEASSPGEIIPVDDSFSEYFPALLAGEAIDPIISNDTYGWLLTIYLPVRNSVGQTVCYACTDISMGQLTAEGAAFVSREISLFLGFFLVILSAGVLIAEYNLVLPVNSIAAAAGAFAYNSADERARNLESIRALDIHSGDEIENLYHAFAKTTEETMLYIAESQKRAETLRDLALASNIQEGALPRHFPKQVTFDLFASMTPAKEVGGDFYDFFMVDEHRLAMVIADVSGKGIPAALFMMQAKAQLRSLAEGGRSVDEIFTLANKQLCENNVAGLFVTSWMCILDCQTGQAEFANAGHNFPALRHQDGSFQFLKSRPGFVLGGLARTKFRKNDLTLAAGDELFLYTDGVTEATDAGETLYGEDRLLHILNTGTYEDAESLCAMVKADVDKFVGDAPQFDDITMLCVRYHGPEGPTDSIRQETT